MRIMLFSDSSDGRKANGILAPFRDAQFLLVFSVAFLVTICNFMLILTLPLHAAEMGAGAKAVGLLSGIFATCALAMRPISGQLIDREDKRTLLLGCLALMLTAVLGLSLARRYWALVACRGLSGVAWGVGSTLCMTIASERFTENRMATGIGVYALGQTLALTLAPALALPIASAVGFGLLYALLAILVAASFAMTLFIRPKPPEGKAKFSFRLDRMVSFPALRPASMTLVNNIAKSSINAFLAIYARSRGVADIGLFFSVQAVAVLAVRPAISALADRFGALRVLIPCEALLLAGFVAISLADSLPAFLVAGAIIGIAVAGEQPILMAECIRSVGPSQRGLASNTSYIGLDVGIVIGSNAAGLLVEAIGFRAMFIAITIPMVAYSVWYSWARFRNVSTKGPR